MNRKKIHWSRTSPGRNKQRGLLGGLLALAMLIPGGVAMAADTDVVEFKDAHFKACVAATLERDPAANITQADMDGIYELSCVNQEIFDISAIRQMLVISIRLHRMKSCQ